MADSEKPQLINASIVVIGFQKEDSRMYPHLYDVLVNLRNVYDEVIYLEDDDRGEGLYSIDIFRKKFISMRGLRALFNKVWLVLHRLFSRKVPVAEGVERDDRHSGLSDSEITSFGSVAKDITVLLRKYVRFFVKRSRLRQKLISLSLRNTRKVILAIDHTAVRHALRYFPDKVVLWSYDIPTREYHAEYHMRIKGGCYEKYITSADALNLDSVIIQDEGRRLLLEEALGIGFKHVIYLPVGLNDSDFCRKAALSRLTKKIFRTVSVIQSGGVGRHRYSDKLVDSFQQWPANYELTLHGYISNNFYDKLNVLVKTPCISTEFYNHASLPKFIDRHDIGFVGYGEGDSNHSLIENASAQLVTFMRLGIPVIAAGSPELIAFINNYGIGIGIASFDEMHLEIDRIICDYPAYSYQARKLYENRFDLQRIFHDSFIHSLDSIMTPPTTRC